MTSSSHEIPVVVLLVKENNEACDRLEKVVEDLADKYRTKTKFVRADATEIIPNYPGKEHADDHFVSKRRRGRKHRRYRTVWRKERREFRDGETTRARAREER